jgi:hypothetical protein
MPPSQLELRMGSVSFVIIMWLTGTCFTVTPYCSKRIHEGCLTDPDEHTLCREPFSLLLCCVCKQQIEVFGTPMDGFEMQRELRNPNDSEFAGGLATSIYIMLSQYPDDLQKPPKDTFYQFDNAHQKKRNTVQPNSELYLMVVSHCMSPS